MNVTETVLIGLAIINALLLILAFLTYINTLGLKFYLTQVHTGLSSVLVKLHSLEQFSQKLGNSFNEFIQVVEGMMEKMDEAMQMKRGQIYKTMDGKYTAGSIEELIEKIRNNNEEEDYFSEEEMEKLRNLFETDDDEEEEE